jgi:hypothetical protein
VGDEESFMEDCLSSVEDYLSFEQKTSAKLKNVKFS